MLNAEAAENLRLNAQAFVSQHKLSHWKHESEPALKVGPTRGERNALV